MKKLVCKTKCFVDGKLYSPGETLDVSDDVFKAVLKEGKQHKYGQFVEFKAPKEIHPKKDHEVSTLSEAQKLGKDSDELFK